MEQLRKLFQSLTLRQKISIALVALVAGSLLYGVSHWRKEADFKALYTGLSPEDAGAVVQKLKEMGVEYRVSDSGSSVLASSARVAELRLEMARAGLPQTGRIGFELFDQTNLGITEFAEQVNFRRALEGELERSVTSLSAVEQARVHLTFPKDSVFLESRTPAKASVMVRLRPGVRLEPQSVSAISHLVASAVEGLAPEAVSVLDMQGHLLSRPRKPLGMETGGSADAMIEYQQQIERDLLRKIHETLEPLLGEDRFRAGVSVECDFTSGEQSEEVFDPTKSVMLTSQTSEDGSAHLATAGVPGTATNLPRPAPRTSAAGSGLSRRTENVTYQSSRTVRRTVLPQGGVKRVSVSLLLDQEVRWEGSGQSLRRVLVPPAPEKMKAVRDLVGGLVNLKPERGDQIIVETLAFDATLKSEPAPQPAAAPAPVHVGGFAIPAIDQRLLILGGAAAAGVLVLLAAGLWLLRKRRKKAPAAKMAGRIPSLDEPGEPLVAPEERVRAQLAEQEVRQQRAEAEILNRIKLPMPKTEKAEVLSKHVRELVKKESTIPVEVLRRWIGDR
jgi:flagellar M-ring protein FliF